MELRSLQGLMINVIGWDLKSLVVLRGGESHLGFCFIQFVDFHYRAVRVCLTAPDHREFR